MNEALYVKADEQSMYLESLGMQSFGNRGRSLRRKAEQNCFGACSSSRCKDITVLREHNVRVMLSYLIAKSTRIR
jgi:hypothetical protein